MSSRSTTGIVLWRVAAAHTTTVDFGCCSPERNHHQLARWPAAAAAVIVVVVSSTVQQHTGDNMLQGLGGGVRYSSIITREIIPQVSPE